MTDAYRLGFIEKCAEYGVDPTSMVKAALPLLGAVSPVRGGQAPRRPAQRVQPSAKPKTTNQGIQPKNTAKPVARAGSGSDPFKELMLGVQKNVPGYFGTPQRIYYNGRPISGRNFPR